MAEGPEARPVNRRTRDVRAAFFHFWSLIIVLIIAGALGFAFPFVSTDAKIVELAMSIFQVSGTMVALVLPASELASTFITKFSDELLLRIVAQDVPHQKKSNLITKLSEELRRNLQPAWRASIYALSSFLLSCVVMFLPDMNTTVRSVPFSYAYFFLGLSLGFLMVGAVWFYPTARYVFQLGLLDDVKRFGEGLVGARQEAGNINDAYQTFVFAGIAAQLSNQWLRRIIADSQVTGQSIPARICCFRRDDGSTWYGGCEIQGGNCHYFGEGCPGDGLPPEGQAN